MKHAIIIFVIYPNRSSNDGIELTEDDIVCPVDESKTVGNNTSIDNRSDTNYTANDPKYAAALIKCSIAQLLNCSLARLLACTLPHLLAYLLTYFLYLLILISYTFVYLLLLLIHEITNND